MKATLTVCWFALFLIFFSPQPFAQPDTSPPLDSTHLKAYLDGLFPAFLKTEHIAGATVAVVKDNRLMFAKGYGYADLENQVPVDPDRTLFRIGSVSKLFVWTAVMQLAEAGKLDLNADVNDYLAEPLVPKKYGEPVTMMHLMTHTPGLGDHVIGLFGRDSSSLAPLDEILKEEMPRRVRPPGQIASYSNHGTGLAALIVERLSGLSWDEYVEQRILDPLGMPNTTFRQPLPDDLAPKMSKGYQFQDGEYVEKGFEYVPLAPVGSASATATDMVRCMIAHLQLGAFQGTTILDSVTAAKMQSPAFRHAEGLNPMRHGFMDYSQNGREIIGHGGDTRWFHTIFAFMPEERVGIFFSFNSNNGGSAKGQVLEKFMDHFFPSPDLEALSPPDPAELEKYTGYYRATRYAHDDLAKLGAMMGAFEVKSTEDGLLQTPGSEKRHWIKIDSNRFREADSRTMLTFRKDAEGRITHMFQGDLPIIAFERIAFWERPPVQLMLLIVSLIIIGLAFLGWPLGWMQRRWYRAPKEAQRLLPFPARLLGWLAGLGIFIFLIGLSTILSDPEQIAFGIPPAMEMLLFVPLVGLLLAAGVLIYTLSIWRRGQGRIMGRVFYTLLAIALIVHLWQLYHWNILGFQY